MLTVEKNDTFTCTNYPCENKVNRLIKIGNRRNNQMISLCDDCLHLLSNKLHMSMMLDVLELRVNEEVK